MRELRPYQTESLNRLRRNIANGVRAQILQLATGGGKTQIASAVMAGAASKGKRAFFIVDSLELVDQAANRFIDDGMSVGVIQGQHELTDYSKPIQVATIQTLRNRWEYITESLKPDVMVIDEAHVLYAAHEEIINECKFKGIPVIGLSATPFRKGLGKHFSELVIGATTAELTKQGFLVPAVCYAPFIPNLQGVKTKANGDWQEDALAEYMGDAAIVGDVVDHWFKLGKGRQTLVFAANVAHSRLLRERFVESGVNAEHVDGYDTDKEARTAKIDAFRRGELQVLCNVGVLTKGFDAPETGCVVMARPTKSLMMHIQMLGRGLRTAPGKHDCIIIDHAGNCLRNGLPTDALPEELDDGHNSRNLDRKQREKPEPVAKACIRCGYLSTKHACPACGFKPEKRQDVEVRNGELYEITESTRKEMPADELARLYAEMLGYCVQQRIKPGWAFYKCKEYAGRAPRATKQIQPLQPSERTLGIIKHLQIKSARRAAA